ncbi:Helix-turn-helix domain-containing protein [Streptoalloteichus tenebrarius]|uniref:Helix-turn-helix domain-containing protein n=1 Tax=Streptoalloteichus tenebrarius (strain ATCC 17920 / DSM 40477 / JCM 4838 / CBS 697.72 / NBRC 16177 / NCIMB 11028 / NRRL B-12390 / A12253. 1 / ISP 5477) TaxID=1933 RepID=A0ABT1HRV0_STRSD|nr:helix-turn-helix transcriptional regulator [Streptoalloteichus tenebrarius]MCP2258246.1 Helix-turn-helix domain-containing protein [Streptoalloteichus tenebrarius]BFF04524.1 helix-turn-helix transcriptional regulator [Streptoalloteichus tenebrarius]
MPGSDATIGTRVRKLRERAGKSRAALAGLLGKSEDWLKKIERGERGLTVQMATRLARQLGIRDFREIYGDDLATPVVTTDRPSHPLADSVGLALTTYLPRNDEPVALDHLKARVHSTWRTWHNSPTMRTDVASALPSLITGARMAVAGADSDADRRTARFVLSEVYHLGQAYLAWVDGATHWYWLTVDRGLQMGEDADNPTARASALMYYAFALRASGQAEGALDVLHTAVEALNPVLESGDHDVWGMRGALHLAIASTAARHLGDPSAWLAVEEADRVASRLPTGYVHPRHPFSRSHVDVHRCWVAQSLGDVSEALRHADAIEPDDIPSRVWQAQHLINVARAYHQRRDTTALLPLVQAERYSREAVQFSLPAREVIADLARNGRDAVRREASALAERVKVLV